MNKEPAKFVFVLPDCEDWEALYMDGKLIAEGHSLTASNVLDAIADIFPIDYEYKSVSDEKAEEGFTENLEDMFD